MIGPDAIPCLPRGVRRHHDRVRNCVVLLAPERVLTVDAVGDAILSRIDGQASVAAICDSLSEAFDATRDVIEPDVTAYLQDLADARILDIRHG